MKTKTKKVYYCDYCKKKSFYEKTMKIHEEHCLANPNNQSACIGCSECQSVKIDLEFKDDSRTANGFFCHHYGLHVYPKIVEAKGLLNKYPETFEDQIPMPKTCEFRTVLPFGDIDEDLDKWFK